MHKTINFTSIKLSDLSHVVEVNEEYFEYNPRTLEIVRQLSKQEWNYLCNKENNHLKPRKYKVFLLDIIRQFKEEELEARRYLAREQVKSNRETIDIKLESLNLPVS